MPYLDLKLSAPGSNASSAVIAERLTALTAEVLEKKRELTAVTMEHLRTDRWFVSGSPLASLDVASFFLEIRVTEGTNTKGEKAAYVQRVFAVLEDLLGPLHPASYIVIHEVRADAWGYAGVTQEYRYGDGAGR